MIYQCVPPAVTNWYVRKRPESGTTDLNMEMGLLDREQQAIYRDEGVYASPYWILQGPFGGHRRRLWPYEATIAQMMGYPELPNPGDLRYAELDPRTLDQLHEADQAARWNRMLEFCDRNTLDAEEQDAKDECTRKLAGWVERQTMNAFAQTSRAEMQQALSELPHGISRSRPTFGSYEEWVESTLIPRQRLWME